MKMIIAQILEETSRRKEPVMGQTQCMVLINLSRQLLLELILEPILEEASTHFQINHRITL